MIKNPGRYSRKLRNKVNKVKAKTTSKHVCPQCGKTQLKRRSFAIYVCKSCGTVIVGGAYEPTTETGRTVKRMLNSIKQDQERDE